MALIPFTLSAARRLPRPVPAALALAIMAVGVVATWVVLAQGAPGAFQNGSFELPAHGTPNLGRNAGDTAMTGWTIGGAGIDQVGPDGWQAAHGTYSIDLSNLDAGNIAQTFATVFGRSYRIDFAMAGNPTGSAGIKSLRVAAAGSQQDFTFDITGRSFGNMGWSERSFMFTANAASATLSFTSLVSGAFGPALDNVRVFESPGTPAAVAGNAWATVNWAAPTESGGSAITSYTVTASPGGRTCVAIAPATSCTVTGLTNGTPYTFTVAATSAAGTGPSSPASNSVTPQGAAGVLDSLTTSAAAGFSVRQLRAAYSGPVMRLRHGTHNAEADLYFNTDGSVSTASPVTVTSTGTSSFTPNQSLTLAQFANGGDVFVRAWYDQSLNARHADASATSQQPRLMSAGLLNTLNGRPKLVFNGSTSRLVTSEFTKALPISFQVVWRINVYKDWGSVFSNLAANNVALHTSTGTISGRPETYLFNGHATTSAGLFDSPSNTQPRLAHIEYNATGSRVWLNGVPSGTLSVGGGSLSGLLIGQVQGISEWWGHLDGDITELLTLDTVASFADRLTLIASQGAYFGISVVLPPNAPTAVTASAGNAWATVSWSAPASNGGSAITNYTVTASPGGRQCVTNSGSSTSCTVTGLINGTAYTFTVTATNSSGTGAASAASNSVTPQGAAGPFDTVSGAAVGYSVRQLRAAYSGPALRVRRTADNAEADLYFDTSGNLGLSNVVSVIAAGSSALAVNQSMTLSQFANGGDVTVISWYDQSSNARHALEISGRTPNLITGGSLQLANARPALRFNGSALRHAGLPTQATTPWSLMAVSSSESGNSAAFSWGNNGGMGARFGLWSTTGTTRNAVESGGTTVDGGILPAGAIALRSWRYAGGTNHAGLAAWFNGATETLSLPGGAVTPSFTTGETVIGDIPAAIGAHPHVGQIGEILLYASVLTQAQRQQLEQGQAGYFGVTYTPERSIAGTVYEDVNYGGGAGRSRATALAAGGSGRSGARVELYSVSGSVATFVSATTTDSNGDYQFVAPSTGTYAVRVVNASVSSARSGYTASLVPVPTARTDWNNDAAWLVTDRVGGTDPAATDGGNGASGTTFNTTTGVFTAGTTGTAQAFVLVTASANVEPSGVDFGFNFNTVVNVNDSGQGSLRQVITNMNALADTGLAIEDSINGGTRFPTNADHAVFMIPNGTAAPGLRAALNYFSPVTGPFARNVATIRPQEQLPDLSTGPMVIDAQTQPGWSGTPIVEMNSTSNPFTLRGSSITLRGFVLNGYTQRGVLITGGANTIQGNWIGLAATGMAAAGAGTYAIRVLGANNLIGGNSASQRNVIVATGPCCSSSHSAVEIRTASAAGNSVRGNYIGTSVDGHTGLGGNGVGIWVQNRAANTAIGGDTVADRNLISGNLRGGVRVDTSSNTVIRGNLIGTNAAGNAAIGNGDWGIYVELNATNAVVGGPSAGQRNVISGNAGPGLYIRAGTVVGNYIGLTADGTTVLPNASDGVVSDGSGITIGGTGSNEGNRIAGNGASGINVINTTRARISGNSIWGNAGLGIDLSMYRGDIGVTPNDGLRSLDQSNDGMDHPVFTTAALDGSTLRLRGYIGQNAAAAMFGGATVEVFIAEDDPSGYGEGRTLLGTLTADASGNFSGQLAAGSVTLGTRLTATATDAGGNTSEFGPNVAVREYLPFRNGSFEDGALGGINGGGFWQLPAASTAVTYWVAGGAGIDVLPSTHTNASDGVRSVHLNPGSAQSFIEQTFDTEPGLLYSVFVDYSGSAACGSTRKSLRVSAAGQTQDIANYMIGGSGVIPPAGSNSVGVYHDTGLVRFTANSDLTTLRFESLSSSACGPIIDNVRVAPAREFTNGSFEQGALDPGGQTLVPVGSTDITGWIITGNWIILAGTPVPPAPSNGVRQIFLNGSGPGGVAQSFDAVPETWLRVRFDYANNSSGPPSASIVVSGDGTSRTLTGAPSTVHAAYDLTYRVQASATTVSFVSTTPGASGPALDNVRVEAALPFINGSFEDVRFPGRATTNLTGDTILMRGWVTAGASLQHLGATSFTPAAGSHSLHLNGSGGAGSVQQTFEVEPGQRYDILFDIASSAGAGTVLVNATVSDGGGAELATRDYTVNTTAWRSRLISFTATSNRATLRFQSQTAGSAGPMLDNVRMGTAGTFNTVGSFNAFESSTTAGAVTGVLRTKVAGAAFTVDIAALDLNRTAYSANALSNVRIELLDASDNSGALDEESGCRTSWVSVGLLTSSFSLAPTDNGRRAFTATVDGIYRAARLRISWTGSSPNLVGCSNDSFAIRPAAFGNAQATDGDADSAGTTRVLDNSNPTSGVVHKAGRPFTLRASAISASGAAMTGYSGTPTLSIAACVQPAGCTAGTLTGTPTISAGNVEATLVYSEAGVIQLQLEDSTFADIDALDEGSSIDERAIRATAPVVVGRFVPDRYVVSPSAPQMAAACTAGNLTFVGQPFTFPSAPTAAVVPVNAAGAALVNARPRFDASMVQPQLVATGAPTTLEGTLGTPLVSTDRSSVELGASSLRFARTATPVAPFAPSLSLRVSVADTTESNNGAQLTLTGEGSTTLAFPAGHLFHYGRLALASTYGDARRDLAVPMQLQSYNGVGWLPLGAAQGCVNVQAVHVGHSQARGTLAAAGGISCNSWVTTVTARAGRWTLRLPRPERNAAGVGEGAMTIHINTGSAGSGQTCTAAGASPALATAALDTPWLAQPDGSLPAARVQWGRPRGDLVQLRERYD